MQIMMMLWWCQTFIFDTANINDDDTNYCDANVWNVMRMMLLYDDSDSDGDGEIVMMQISFWWWCGDDDANIYNVIYVQNDDTDDEG